MSVYSETLASQCFSVLKKMHRIGKFVPTDLPSLDF